MVYFSSLYGLGLECWAGPDVATNPEIVAQIQQFIVQHACKSSLPRNWKGSGEYSYRGRLFIGVMLGVACYVALLEITQHATRFYISRFTFHILTVYGSL